MTETTTTEAAADDRLGVGNPCGVCQFPAGRAEDGTPQICGNVVYVNVRNGQLPKYCGQEGQDAHQAAHGTPGNPGHRSELAGYPRKQLGLSSKDTAAIARAMAADLGIGLSTLRPADAAPAAAAPVVAAASETGAPEESVSALDALGDLARVIGERVAAVRAEMDSVRAESAHAVAETESERVRLADAMAAELAALMGDREQARAITEDAARRIGEADDNRLRAEGALAAANQRIATLETALIDVQARHRTEIAEVRAAEEARYDRLVAAFAKTRDEDTAPAAAPVTVKTLTAKARRDRHRMLAEVRSGAVGLVSLFNESGEPGAGLRWRLGDANMNDSGVRVARAAADAGLIAWSASDQEARELPEFGLLMPVRLTDAGTTEYENTEKGE